MHSAQYSGVHDSNSLGEIEVPVKRDGLVHNQLGFEQKVEFKSSSPNNIGEDIYDIFLKKFESSQSFSDLKGNNKKQSKKSGKPLNKYKNNRKGSWRKVTQGRKYHYKMIDSMNRMWYARMKNDMWGDSKLNE